MNDLVNNILSLRRLNRRKIMVGSILFLVQTLVVFFWLTINAPIAISPAGSLAIALLFLVGSSYWPTIFLGTFIGMILADTTILPLFACALSYTLQGIVGARFLRTFEFDLMLSRLRDSVILVAVLACTALIYPSISFGMEFLFGADTLSHTDTFTSGLSWGSAWIASLFSTLIFTPFILRWAVMPQPRTFNVLMETVLTLGITATISILLFWTNTQDIGGISLAYFLFAPLFVSSIRLGPRMTITALTMSASIGLTSFISSGMVRALTPTELQALFQTELFFGMLSILFLIIVSIEEERKEKTKELEAHVSGLRTEIRELSDDDRLKNEFIATLAHELRNPLAPVVSTLELLRMREELSREALELVTRVEHQTNTVKRLLDDLLDVTRITQKKFKLRKVQASLRELITHSVNNAEHLMNANGHRFRATLPTEDVLLSVDPTRFEQIVTNLLYNAAKYTEHGGQIDLVCKTEGKNVILTLTDNGIGINPESLEQIFLPFRQMRTKHHTGTGIGIGLSITKQLVEMHDGNIVAYSEGVGKGSQFVVTLPIIVSENSTEIEPHTGNEKSPRQSFARTILVVDDNTDAAQALTRLLEHRGHTVYVAHTGMEALENARLFKPEVVLLDIGLPDIEGYEVARRLRSSGFRSKLIALTGYGQEEDRIKAEEAQFDHHLVKPVSLSEIEKLI